MAIFVTFKTKDTMKSFFILLSLYYFLVVNVVSADSVIWGIERSGFFNGRGKWAKGFENQRV